jgi:hypothetical protein
MAQSGDRPRLFHEIRHDLRTAHIRPMHDLDRNVTFERRFDGLENLAHATFAELLQNEIRPHAGTGRKRLVTRIHEPEGKLHDVQPTR